MPQLYRILKNRCQPLFGVENSALQDKTYPLQKTFTHFAISILS